MEKIERIGVLLDFYRDVVAELRDRGGSCSGPPDRCSELDCRRMGLCIVESNVLPMMCRSWNHPSYRELERLRPVLRERWPVIYGHVATRYFRPQFERRIARCRCGELKDASWIGRPHGHKVGRSGTFVPFIDRSFGSHDPDRVAAGIEWFARHWKGEAEIPSDIRAILHQRQVQKLVAA